MTATFASAPNPGQGVHDAAKAKSGISKCCQVSCQKNCLADVLANCISPGLGDRPMMIATSKQGGSIFLERKRPKYSLHTDRTEDLVQMKAFLILNKSRWLTAQNIAFAGGY